MLKFSQIFVVFFFIIMIAFGQSVAKRELLLTGIIVDVDSTKLKSNIITIHNNDTISYLFTDTFSIALEKGGIYQILFFQDNYSDKLIIVDTRKSGDYPLGYEMPMLVTLNKNNSKTGFVLPVGSIVYSPLEDIYQKIPFDKTIKTIEIEALPFHSRFLFGINTKNIHNMDYLYLKYEDDNLFSDIFEQLMKLEVSNKLIYNEVRTYYKFAFEKDVFTEIYVTLSGLFVDNKGNVYKKNEVLSILLFSLLPERYN